MSKVEYVALRPDSLTNLEAAQINTTTLIAIKKLNFNLKAAPELNRAIKKLEEALVVYEGLLNQDKPISAKVLAELDKQRAIDLRHLIWFIIIAQASRNPLKKAIADELFDLVKDFKSASSESYEKETALIRKLFARLDKEPFQEKINQIGAREVVDNLRASQEEFYQLYLSYNKYKKQNNSKLLKEKKTSLLTIYTSFYHLLSAVVAIDEQKQLEPILTVVNNVRRDYAETIKRRRKKKKKMDPPEHNAESPHPKVENQPVKDVIPLEEKAE